ncbi:unnamed protein product, partial [Meganyctiphanes norvegica]
ATPNTNHDSVDVETGLEADRSATKLINQSGHIVTRGYEKEPDVEQARPTNGVGSCSSFRNKFKNWKYKSICLIFIVCLLLFTIGAVIGYTLCNCTTLCSEADESSLSKDSTYLQNNTRDSTRFDEDCSYQTVCGNQTNYHQFKNGTSIRVKLNNVQQELKIVTGITFHHPMLSYTTVSALIEIVHGAEGLVLKGTGNNHLLNDEDSWKTEQLHLFPSLGDTFTLNF